MAKLFDLAKENISKTDEAKALDLLTEAVEDNKMAFANDLHEAKKAVKICAKRVQELKADPYATAAQIINATREVALAEKYVRDVTTVMADRF
jgi:hypothetical protein